MNGVQSTSLQQVDRHSLREIVVQLGNATNEGGNLVL